MKKKKTIERSIYIEVGDDEEGQKILDKFAILLIDSRHNKSYLNGWMGPYKK